MNRIFFLAVPAVVLTASVALGDDGRVAEARAKYSLIDSLRFDENDLAKLERMTLTSGTVLRGTIQSAAIGATEPIVAAPQPQWFEPSTQFDTLNNDGNLKAPKIGISTPLVRVDDRAINDSELVIDELAMAATPIPEPASVTALATLIGLRVVGRRVRK